MRDGSQNSSCRPSELSLRRNSTVNGSTGRLRGERQPLRRIIGEKRAPRKDAGTPAGASFPTAGREYSAVTLLGRWVGKGLGKLKIQGFVLPACIAAPAR